MKNIAYILLCVIGIKLTALIIWGVMTLFSIGMNEKAVFIVIFGGIASFGLIGRVIYVMKDSRKQ
jgi:hypothetical protein